MVHSSSRRILLRVSPGAKRSAITGRHGEGWKVRVNVAPEKGKANEELIRLLHDTLDVAHDDIMIVRGHGSRDKLVEISGLDETELDRRLSDAVGKTG